MSAYYNELDAEKAAVIREAIAAQLLAPGDVDTRSITEVQPEDVSGYTQCHFFAGAGLWSYALRLAGWPDDRPVWTGSCPCPSFSCAGKGEGFDDARHLWPAWYSLIRQCRPGTVFGEQVAAAIGHGWLDLVCGDMEAEEYAITAAVLGAHSAGAPHIRQRLYFCAHAQLRGRQQLASQESEGVQCETPNQAERLQPVSGHDTGALFSSGADTADARPDDAREHGSRPSLFAARPEQCGGTGKRTHADGWQSSDRDLQRSREQRLLATDRGAGDSPDADNGRDNERQGEVSPSNKRAQQGRAVVRDWRYSDAGNGGDAPLGGLAMRGSTPGNAGYAARTSEPLQRDNAESGGLEYGQRVHAEHDGEITDDGREPLSGSDAAGMFSELTAGQGTRPGKTARGRSCCEPPGHGNFGDLREWRGPGWLDPLTARSVAAAGATRGFWADCDWWYGRDGKYRPIEPGIFPLANGYPARVLALRCWGDAICPEVAALFIEAAIPCLPEVKLHPVIGLEEK